MAYRRHSMPVPSGPGSRVFGELTALTTKEFDLLAYLATEPGKTRSKDEILREVCGLDFNPGSNVVSVVVCSLRKKLDKKGLVEAIKTV